MLPPTNLTPPSPPTSGARAGKKMRIFSIALLLLVVLAVGFGGGWLGAKQVKTDSQVQKEQIILQTQGELIRNIADKVGPSVVSVTVKGQASAGFFGYTELEGAGTGIILTEDGLIVTNRHVVPTGTTDVTITLADGTEYESVKIIGRTGSNDSLDIAFLKINDTKGKKLVPAIIGDSANTKVGDPVVAIGNALGQFQNTVTSGIISGYGRNIQASSGDGGEAGNLENLFQTDAAINPGNSGGPLVDLSGQVVGINTAVAADGAQGIGFAIPINDIVGLIASVKEKGVLERPFIGVMYIPLTNDVAKAYGLNVTRGAYILPEAEAGGQTVLPGGPADKAGIKAGDIIIKIDDKSIDQNNSLSSLINKHRVNDVVKVSLLRDGKEQTVDATLGAAPTD
ncbi:MAG TPA: trypsin-like peptidase domain-containing protein [Candidatus Saccharimonadales bacterium]|nr:trypsin-like peptidase domain-containing protein [Candidatus Saccharimonadales bacterium]